MRSSSGPTKVLYLTPGCFDKGGISRYNRYQIRALRELVGHENVAVYSVLGPDQDSFEDAFEVSFFAGGLRRSQKARFLIEATRSARSQKPDIVLAAHIHLSATATVLAKASGASSVLNVYGSEVWSGLRPDSRFGITHTRHVVADCHFTARYIEQQGLRTSGSTSVVWDCVDLTQFCPGDPNPRVLEKYGIPDPLTGKNLLTLGRMSPDAKHKGYARLLDAFSRVAPRVPDLRLIFAGRGDLVKELRAEADARGLGHRVFFTGMIEEYDMADVYRSAHIFSLISDRCPGGGEGIPLTPLEAAACGAPILVGNQDGSQEAIIGGANGFVMGPFEIDEHAAKIEMLATNELKRSEMGRAAVRTIEAEFSYPRFREQHRALLQTWMPRGAHPA